MMAGLWSACAERHGHPSLPACEPYVPAVTIQGNTLGPGGPYTLSVVEATDARLSLADDAGADGGGDWVVMDFEAEATEGARLPVVGAQVEVQADSLCAESGRVGYVRVTAPGGPILFEGGDPACLSAADAATLDPDALLDIAAAALDAASCQTADPCVIAEPRDVRLRDAGREQIVPSGEARDAIVEDQPYRAFSAGARRLLFGDCGVVPEGDTLGGSAFVVPLDE